MRSLFRGDVGLAALYAALVLLSPRDVMAELALAEFDTFEAQAITVDSGDELSYSLYIPPAYDPKNAHPLVLYLHGAIGRSPSNGSQIFGNNQFGARAWADPSIQTGAPPIVVAPLIETDNPLFKTADQWVDVPFHRGSHTQPDQPTPWIRLTLELLDVLEQQFNVDPTRRYAAGFSMGGYGVWDIITRRPNYFAAAIPVSGGGDPSKAPLIKDTPIWAFHGALDSVVPVSGSRDMINALTAAGGSPRYTEFSNLGHGILAETAFTDDSGGRWLLAQQRPDVLIPEPSAGAIWLVALLAGAIRSAKPRPSNPA